MVVRLSAAGRIRSIEKPSDLIGNGTLDLLACSIVPFYFSYFGDDILTFFIVCHKG
jgi:hypothetical protein